VLDLEKSFTTSAGHASFYVLSTRSPDAASHADFTGFIVDGKNARRPGRGTRRACAPTTAARCGTETTDG
jgi:alkylation response protein AidB-like acyl-CoA dehydrogenase